VRDFSNTTNKDLLLNHYILSTSILDPEIIDEERQADAWQYLKELEWEMERRMRVGFDDSKAKR
jgi:hypothetical protein